ncbi:MAG: hypothetical protein HKM28_01360 [Flavobacteriaceae bacterium]|nr:hypothetical protein [Flavobacteriaceae bacterium]
MKNLLVIMAITAATSMFAQEQKQTVNVNNTFVIEDLSKIGAGAQNLGTSSVIINPPKKVEGSVHLFDGWNNRGVFVTNEDKQYSLKNINYNVQRNVFESQIGKDSVFTFNTDNVEKIVINNRPFKSVYNPAVRAESIYEVIFENEDFAILKRYELEVEEGSDNPMVIRPSRFILNDSYWVKKRNSVRSLKFKKKDIIKLAGKDAKALAKYADENDLSFRDDADVTRILNGFYSKN